jgi:hypothetical protein
MVMISLVYKSQIQNFLGLKLSISPYILITSLELMSAIIHLVKNFCTAASFFSPQLFLKAIDSISPRVTTEIIGIFVSPKGEELASIWFYFCSSRRYIRMMFVSRKYFI